MSDRCVFPEHLNRLQIAGVIYLDEGDIDADRKTVSDDFYDRLASVYAALSQKQKMRRHNGHWTDTNHGGRRRNRGRVSGGEVVDITAVLIGDGGDVILPTDPDELAAVTALLDSLARNL